MNSFFPHALKHGGLAVASLFTLHAAAQSNTAPIGTIVVTATRTAQRADDALAQTALITRDDIEAASTASLVELLQARAGVEIRATGGAGQPAGVFIRGATAQQTLVLVDGVRIGSATSGSAAFENIALDLIERIEVVKGPMSGLYGADAIGGVVQIFTRTHAKPRLSASVSVGTDSTLGAAAGLTTVEDKTAITLNVGYQEAKPRSASNAAAGPYTYNPDRDPYSNTNFLAKVSHSLWQGETVSASLWQSRGRVSFDDGVPGNPSNRQILSGAQVASQNNFASFWKSNLRLSQSVDDTVTTSAYPSVFKTTQSQIQWQNDLATPVGTWIVGFERLAQKVASDTPFDKTSRTTGSVFLGVNETIGEQRLSANLRRDSETQFGARTTGAASYGWQIAADHLMYVSYGEAFRAPSFNDLYYPGFSNPTLRPEKSKSREIGWRHSSAAAQLNVVVFDNRIADLIAFDFATSLPQNVLRARIQGVELGAKTTIMGVALTANATVQRPEDTQTGKQLRSRAKQFGTVSATRDVGVWSLGATIVSSGARFDSGNESAASRTAGYATLNVNARYQINKLWSVAASVQNLTDKTYETTRGYNTPGRGLFVTARMVAF